MIDLLIKIVIPILLTLLVWLWLKFREIEKHWDFRNMVAWFWEWRSSWYSFACYVIKKQSLPDSYYLNKKELEYAEMILDEYEKYFCEHYFKNRLVERTEIRDGEAYFFYSLSAYLVDHERDSKFAGHEMLGETVSSRKSDYKENFFGVMDYRTYYTYKMTDFSIAYNKLLLISLIYCKNSKLLRDAKITYGDFEDYYVELIQNGLIER